MVKRRSATRRAFGPSVLVPLGVVALVLFVAGELFAWAASDPGRLAIWRHLGWGDRASAVRIVGRRIEQGLQRAGVPRTAIDSRAKDGAGPALVWTVTLAPDGAPLLVNDMVTRAVEAAGRTVLSGREQVRADGTMIVSLLLGVPGRATHALEIVRPGRPRVGEARPAKLAVLL